MSSIKRSIDKSDDQGKDLQQRRIQYQEYKTITEDMFDELMRVGIKTIEEEAPDNKQAIDVMMESRVKFMKNKPAEYQELLDKYIRKLYEAHLQDVSKKMGQKNAQIRQLESSRRSAENEKEALEMELKDLKAKSKDLKEWNLVELLVGWLDRPDQSAWVHVTKGQLRSYTARFKNVSTLRLSSEQSEKIFLDRLMKLCQLPEQDINQINNYLTKYEEELKSARQETSKLKNSLEQQQIQIVKKESQIDQKRKNINERQSELEKRQSEIQLQLKKSQQQNENTNKKLAQIELHAAKSISQAQSWISNGKKWEKIESIMNRKSLNAVQKLKEFQSLFSLAESDQQLHKLAQNWVNNQRIQEQEISFQRILLQRLRKQKIELIDSSGLRAQFIAKANQIQSIVQKTIKLSITTFNAIQQRMIEKLFGSRLAPINDSIINFDLDNIVDVLTKQYETRAARICQKMDLVRVKNDRKIAEFITRKAQ